MIIHPGRGIDDILFGRTPNEVLKILGPPKKKEEIKNENESYITLYYESEFLRFSFDELNDWKLSEISAETNKVKLFNLEIIGIKKELLLEILHNQKITDCVISNVAKNEGWTHELLELEDLSINIWLENEEVQEIQWGPFWIDENTIDWPE